ncbi:peptidoglycan-binding protein [Sphingomonas sp. RHCKR7]|nr:peptidoglycan-binding protein [Sphingomonas folli]
MSPTARARLIYGEAKAGTATRLWEAMLGDRVDVAPVSRRASVGENGRVVAVAASDGGWSALLALPMPSGAAAPANLDSAHRDASSRRQPPTHAPTASPPTASVMPLGPNQDYAPWLRAAADRTGVPGPAIAAIVGAEAARGGDGRWLPLSRNPRSSAAGLGQFLSRTWIGEAERAGTWLHQLATTNGWLTAEGRVRRDARSAVLALRYDARAAIETVADHARHNLAQLRAVKVIAGESLEAVTRTAYVAHHLGIGDAIQFLRDALDPARAARLLVAQIGVNAAADRIGRSVDAVAAHRSWLTDFMARAVKPRQTY